MSLEVLEGDAPLLGVLPHDHRELLREADDQLHLRLAVLGPELDVDLEMRGMRGSTRTKINRLQDWPVGVRLREIVCLG